MPASDCDWTLLTSIKLNANNKVINLNNDEYDINNFFNKDEIINNNLTVICNKNKSKNNEEDEDEEDIVIVKNKDEIKKMEYDKLSSFIDKVNNNNNDESDWNINNNKFDLKKF